MGLDLVDRIKKHEGYRRFVYQCTMDKQTIGYGTMIEEGGHGVPEHIAELLLLCLPRDDPSQGSRPMSGIPASMKLGRSAYWRWLIRWAWKASWRSVT